MIIILVGIGNDAYPLVANPLVGAQLVPGVTIFGIDPVKGLNNNSGGEGDVNWQALDVIVDRGCLVDLQVGINGFDFLPVVLPIIELDVLALHVKSAIGRTVDVDIAVAGEVFPFNVVLAAGDAPHQLGDH